MAIFVSESRRIVYRGIARTASHSIRTWLRAQLGDVEEHRIGHTEPPDARFDGFLKFGCVRNPFTRLASGYLYMRGRGHIDPDVRFDEWAIGVEDADAPAWRPMTEHLPKDQWAWIQYELLPTSLGLIPGTKPRLLKLRNVSLPSAEPLYIGASMVDYVLRRYDSDFTAFGYDRTPPA